MTFPILALLDPMDGELTWDDNWFDDAVMGAAAFYECPSLNAVDFDVHD